MDINFKFTFLFEQVFNYFIKENIFINNFYIFRTITEQLDSKISKLIQLNKRMINKDMNKRPDCEKILNERMDWILSFNDIKNDIKTMKQILKVSEIYS